MRQENGDGKRRFHTATFDKIDESRREAILAVALGEFADRGFNGASINGLARKAGISIGSLYSYFPSKEDLFLSLVDRGHDLLVSAIGDVDPDAGFMDTFALLLRKARDYASSNPELNLVYLEATTQGLRHLAERLSLNLETVSADMYRECLTRGIARGELKPGLDLGATAFCLDNILLLYQFSFASDYHRDRLRIFLGTAEGREIDGDSLLSAILDFVRYAVTA
jgi:TetR/AcrR family transcriptional regulator